MQSWNLLEIDAPGGTRSPVVVFSDEEARAVLISLEPGQELGDHQVKERAFVVVVGGSVRLDADEGGPVDAGVGTLAVFDPDERHVVASKSGARILLLLAPWPGDGHYRGEEREVGSPEGESV